MLQFCNSEFKCAMAKETSFSSFIYVNGFFSVCLPFLLLGDFSGGNFAFKQSWSRFSVTLKSTSQVGECVYFCYYAQFITMINVSGIFYGVYLFLKLIIYLHMSFKFKQQRVIELLCIYIFFPFSVNAIKNGIFFKNVKKPSISDFQNHLIDFFTDRF